MELCRSSSDEGLQSSDVHRRWIIFRVIHVRCRNFIEKLHVNIRNYNFFRFVP